MCHKTTRNKSMKGYMRHARQHNGMRFFAFFIHHFSYQDLDSMAFMKIRPTEKCYGELFSSHKNCLVKKLGDFSFYEKLVPLEI